MNDKKLIIGLMVGLLVGGLVAISINRQSEPYSIQIMNFRTALKINRRTGETWALYVGEHEWNLVTNSIPKKAHIDFIPEKTAHHKGYEVIEPESPAP